MFGERNGKMKGSEPTERTVAEKKAKVLKILLGNNGRVQLTIRDSRVARKTIDKWREEDAVFAAAWDETIETCVEELEAEGWRRATGYQEPLVYQGKIQGNWIDPSGQLCSPDTPDATFVPSTVTKFSDNLLMFMLKGHRPEKYRDGPGVTKAGQMTEEEMDRTIANYMKRRDRQAGRPPELITETAN